MTKDANATSSEEVVDTAPAAEAAEGDAENSGLPAEEYSPDVLAQEQDEPLTPAATAPEDSIPEAELTPEEVEEMTGLQVEEVHPPTAETYFDDDEEFLRGDDRVLQAEQDAALFQQLDNVVSYNLVNFYGDEGKRRGKYSLRNDPPLFRIESSAGDVAEFVVTRELSEHLAHLFDTVRRGYYGVDAKKKRSGVEGDERGGKISEITHWFESNPRRAAIIVGLLVLSVLTAFLI